MVRYVGSASDLVKATFPEVVGEGRVQAWVVGPGGGDEAAAHLAAAVEADVPLVVDADALAPWKGRQDRPSGTTTPAISRGQTGHLDVLTPHAGELAQLLNVERGEIEARPLHFVRAAAEQFNAVVLLKGRRTLIAQPDGPTRVNLTGTPWLATAGAGDVLAGLIGSLLAAGLTPFDAASVGAWVHGEAATRASGGGPLTATRVAQELPGVVGDLST
jgi:hydroxyethylthiazole kinase-like uncharacterized protein yjeF